ncbi:hypothetical protein DACRYDRAFT_97824 [Dacryopinax primogenitus]|uniref:Hepatocellular carcinoma-associated antigen 59-domain-containing protein n=1 Tax=Dacryopinax primogenitus (strain DJM 731) TaxID=1858805 RepID=M5GCP5_DACPD|nr:uncharacterized protein DACRYDRAFT_97824 [Dacryopinax primogenitus]EJU06340.1 hypothetical protein DACRYDRAFT_97824 [Dacryopinax primogenitus]
MSEPMFKKRTRPANAGKRRADDLGSGASTPVVESTPEPHSATEDPTEDARSLGLEDIIALRKYRQGMRHEGIDVGKLSKGEKRKRNPEGEDDGAVVEKGGLKRREFEGEVESSEAESIAKKLRANNFTQQTNALDVNKHMMEYIEGEIRKRRGDTASTEEGQKTGAYDPYAQLFKTDVKPDSREEAAISTSMAMLTAIPEVDLGMETRLRNIEETEKAKRQAAERVHARKLTEEEEGLAALRFMRRTKEEQSPAIALMNARLEAQGFAPTPPTKTGQPHKPRTATDDQAVERFKQRMQR